MRSYELMVIVNPDLETEALESALQKVEKLITDNAGQVESVDRWGKKRLAYEINHIREAQYALFYFTGQPATIKEVDRVLRITDEVMRFMVFKRPDKDKARSLVGQSK